MHTGLFDGHDGSDAASYCSANFTSIIFELNELEMKSDERIRNLLKRIFNQ